MKDRIFRKVTIVGQTYGYWEIEDITEAYYDTGENAEEYFAPGEYDGNSGYALGFLESISQSDYCPPFLWYEDINKVIIEDVKTAFNHKS